MMLSLSRTFRALRHRNFRLFFIGQGLSMMGTWLQQVAMGWLTYRLSGSAWLLGVVAFCGNVGHPRARHVRRRRSPTASIARRALYVTQSLMLLQAVVLAALTAVGHIAGLASDRPGAVARHRAPRSTSRLRQSLWVHLIEDRADLAERDRAQFVPGQRGARGRPRARGAAACGRQRSGVLRAQRACRSSP